MKVDKLHTAALKQGQTVLFKRHKRPKTYCAACNKPIKSKKEAYVRYPDGKKVHLKCWEEERIGEVKDCGDVNCPIEGNHEEVFIDETAF